jgi:hypothetical protein
VELHADISMPSNDSLGGDQVDGVFLLFGESDGLVTELPSAFQGLDVAITQFQVIFSSSSSHFFFQTCMSSPGFVFEANSLGRSLPDGAK